jgi:hypothetical protein
MTHGQKNIKLYQQKFLCSVISNGSSWLLAQWLLFMSSDEFLRYKLTARLTHSELRANIWGRKNRPWPILRQFPAIFLDGWRKPTETPFLVTIGKDFYVCRNRKIKCLPPSLPLVRAFTYTCLQFPIIFGRLKIYKNKTKQICRYWNKIISKWITQFCRKKNNHG